MGTFPFGDNQTLEKRLSLGLTSKISFRIAEWISMDVNQEHE
jgi:hypothetical protein